MYKLIVILALFAATSCTSTSRKAVPADNSALNRPFTDFFTDDIPGQYVYYLDKRGENSSLVGIIKFNKTEYAARRYDMKKGTDTMFQFRPEILKDGDVDIIPVRVYSGNTADTAILLNDLKNMIVQSSRYKKTLKADTSITDPWPEFGYTLKHIYNAWIPLFHLNRTLNLNRKNSTFELLLTGHMKGNKDLYFFKIKSLPEAKDSGTFSISNTGNTDVFSFGRYKIRLDGNWKKINFGTEIMQGFWLSKNSLRDAQVSIEVLPMAFLKKFGLNDIKKALIRQISIGSCIIPSTVRITKHSKFYKSTYTVLDPANGYETYMVDIYSQDQSGNMHVFHFSAFKSLYNKNRNYFDSIITKTIKDSF